MSSEVEKTVAMLSVTIPAGIQVVTHIPSSLPQVRIDPIDVQQILVNLAVNARDAIGDHGVIEISLKHARINHNACSICHKAIDGEYVILEVKDSGGGIPAHLQQRIFDPFFTTKEVGKGSGLGLSMVQGLVLKNNGHLLIESDPGQGASFQLFFPFVDGQTPPGLSP
jgi:signal transduction histidine kinase